MYYLSSRMHSKLKKVTLIPMIGKVWHTHFQQVRVSHVQLIWCETLLPLLEILVVIGERYLMLLLRVVKLEATSRDLELPLLGLLQV